MVYAFDRVLFLNKGINRLNLNTCLAVEAFCLSWLVKSNLCFGNTFSNCLLHLASIIFFTLFQVVLSSFSKCSLTK